MRYPAAEYNSAFIYEVNTRKFNDNLLKMKIFRRDYTPPEKEREISVGMD